MEDARPNLDLLRLNQEAMLRLPANEIQPQLILRTSANVKAAETAQDLVELGVNSSVLHSHKVELAVK